MSRLTSDWALRLRRWQEEAQVVYDREERRDFLLVAAPGAGKTTALLHLAHRLLRSNTVERLVVVVPTETLKTQWRKAAEAVGICLQEDWQPQQSERETPDFLGIVLTYQHLRWCSQQLRTQCARIRTLVMLDEIHHAGHDLAWGESAHYAFHPATRRIACSGTPFRSDSNRIPFVNYSSERRSIADYTYSYGAGLAEGILRPIYFPTHEGEMRWISEGKEYFAQFADELPEPEARRRLRTALDLGSTNWLPRVLSEADQQLASIRTDEQTNAGGLVVAIDTDHAREIARLLPDAVTVSYEDPKASDQIEAFKSNTTRWIVAVRMVSEGVDIPRLRMAVYATTIISELFFRQLVGRISRGDEPAYLYLPADPDLLLFARALKEERDHELEEELDEQRLGKGRDGEVRMPLAFQKLSAEAYAHDLIYDGGLYSIEELDAARRWAAENELPTYVKAELLAFILRRLGINTPKDERIRPARPAVSPHDERVRLRKLRRRMVAQVAAIMNKEPKDINLELIRLTGAKVADQTLDQLRESIEWLKNQLLNGHNPQS